MKPIQLLNDKYVKVFDTLQHPDFVRVMILAITDDYSMGFLNIFIIDLIKYDGSTATYIYALTIDGVWKYFVFDNESICENPCDEINPLIIVHADKKIYSLVKDYLCQLDGEMGIYRYRFILKSDFFTKTDTDDLKVFNAVWYQKGTDLSSFAENDRYRFSYLLKKCDSIKFY